MPKGSAAERLANIRKEGAEASIVDENYDGAVRLAAKKAEENTVSHDNIFHTILALMEIRSKTYDKSLDMFDPCRLEPLP